MNEGQPAIQPIESTNDDRLWALLAYLFTPIIPIILLFIESKKERPFIKYHNIHALVLGIAGMVINLVLGVVLIGICTSILTLGLFIFLGIKAYQGEVFEIPVITNFVKNQGWI